MRHRVDARWIALGAAATLAFGCHSAETPTQVKTGPEMIYPGIPVTRQQLKRVEIASTEKVRLSEDVVKTKPQSAGLHDPQVEVIRSSHTELPPIQSVPEATLDLGVALRLAGIDNPTIARTSEAVREALAGQLAARALLLPSVNLGGNFRLHRGAYLAASGFVREVDIQSAYLGIGAGAIGGGPPVLPGVRLFAHLSDAVYEPLAARQRVTVRAAEAQAVRNSTLLDVATAYLQLVGAESRLDIIRRGETDLAEIVRLTAVYAKTGQGRLADANRAAANLDLLRRDQHRAEEEIAVASARLCGLLNLDPSIGLRTPGGQVDRFRLIPEESTTEVLIATALRARPEVLARSAAIGEAQARVKQEQTRPWLPTLSVGYSYGGMAGGSNLVASEFSSLAGRSNFDVFAVWTLQNLGMGNRARVREADALTGAAVAELEAATNQIRREVAAALADVHAAETQIKTAETAVGIAEDGFKLEMERIRQGQGLPLEVLDSFRQLLDSRQELLRAVIAFDIAQFRLFVAVGRTPEP